MTPNEAPDGATAYIGHPDNGVLIFKLRNTWYYEKGGVVRDEDFRAGWHLIPEASEEVRNMDLDHDGDDAVISAGWSITVGQLRAALRGVPDDYEVMLDNAEVDDCEISNVNISRLYPPSVESPGLVVLGGGQIVTSEYAYHQRMDAHHLIGGDLWWNQDDHYWFRLEDRSKAVKP